jgi:hypothetical protein
VSAFRRLTFFLFLYFFQAPVLAGGGPENLALVVNPDSWASKAVANEFIHLRRVPPTHVVYLNDFTDFETIDVSQFRRKILQPVLDTLAVRGLTPQIDYLVYAPNIPYAIDVKADAAGHSWPHYITPTAAINSLTYLYRKTLARDPSYLAMNANRYMRWPMHSAPLDLPPRSQKAYQQALQALKKEDWPAAEILLRELKKRHPALFPIHYRLALSLARQGQEDEANRIIDGAFEIAWPNYASSPKNRQQIRQWQHAGFFDVQPTQAFNGAYTWNLAGERDPSADEGYLLSTMLGITSGRGNSVNEVRQALQRSVAADGKGSAGTIYFPVNPDIRSKARQAVFPVAVAHLRHLGVQAEILDGTVPLNKDDVQGASVGIYQFDWSASGSRILPGAICEHMTSFGAVLRPGVGRTTADERDQTPLTEFIRHGAAASGAVAEPFAVWQKFPYAFIHVHYARGVSIAEAFYQSVAGPYQLLIVGDPLGQLWARIPTVRTDGLTSGAVLRGIQRFTPSPILDDTLSVDHYELYVDGLYHGQCPSNGTLELDTTAFADGSHELRIIAVGAAPIYSRGRFIWSADINNHGDRLKIHNLQPNSLSWDQPLRLEAQMIEAREISFYHNSRLLTSITGSNGTATIDPVNFGREGPVRIQTRALSADGRLVHDPTLAFTILPPSPNPALTAPPLAALEPGLLLETAGADPVIIQQTNFVDWLDKAGIRPAQAFTLSGYFNIPAATVHQFQLRSNTPGTFQLDDLPLSYFSGTTWHFLPQSLTPGLHRFRLQATAGTPPQLELRFGGQGWRRSFFSPSSTPTRSEHDLQSSFYYPRWHHSRHATCPPREIPNGFNQRRRG